MELIKSWDFISLEEVSLIAATARYSYRDKQMLALITDVVVHKFNHVVLKRYNSKLSFKPRMLSFQKLVIEGNFTLNELNLLKKQFIVALRREFLGYLFMEKKNDEESC